MDRGKKGMKRSPMTDGYGIPKDRVLATASRHDSRRWLARWTSSGSTAAA